MTSKYVIAVILCIQAVCAFFFIGEITMSVLGLPFSPINWEIYELIEIGAAVGLLLGVLLGAIALRQARVRSDRAEAALRRTRAAFREMLTDRFDNWELTPAEQDVAMFAIKGFSTSDMARLRGVSEGTIKAQTAAIYRKAGVAGRSQLLSLFIDELVDAEDQSSQA